MKIVALLLALLLIAASSDEIRDDIADLQSDIDAAVEQYEQAKSEQLTAQEQLEQTEQQLAVYEQQVNESLESAHLFVRELYKGRAHSTPELIVEYIFETDSIDDAVFMTLVQERQQADIEAVVAQQQALDAVEELQQDAVTELVLSTEQLEQSKSELNSALEAAEEKLEQVLEQERIERERQARIERERQARIERERQARIERQRQARAPPASPPPASPAPSRPAGQYACPLSPSVSHFIDSWGYPRSGGRRHRGTDIMGPMNAPAFAYTNGVISRHSNSNLGGISLYLRGDDGNTYFYAHLNGYTAAGAVGNRVSAGDHIAYNGATGNASPSAPHIHFEQHPGGNAAAAVNPFPGLARACR